MIIGAIRRALILALVSSLIFGCAERTDPEPPEEIRTVPSRVAITIDDLPYVMPSRTTVEEGMNQAQAIIATLEKQGVEAVGFAVGQHVTAETAPLMDMFVNAGHVIGNHSWSHPDYGTLDEAAFRDETLRTDQALRPWLGNDVDHILLIHMNRINADHLSALLDWYAGQGWSFIPVQDALKDPVFSMPDLYAGRRGLSQIERVLGGPQ